MFSRIRWYLYGLFFLAAGYSALLSWWSFTEVELFDVVRELGIVECLQMLGLAFAGFGACLLGRYPNPDKDNPLRDGAFGQTFGAVTLLLIYRELDYFLTDMMDEPAFLRIWVLLISMAGVYALTHIRSILGALKQLIRMRAVWFLASGGFLYLVVAQVIGTKDFKRMFYPDFPGISRRFAEESLELAAISLLCIGILELHLQLRSRKEEPVPSRPKPVFEEIARAFQLSGPDIQTGGVFSGEPPERKGYFPAHDEVATAVEAYRDTEPAAQEHAYALVGRLSEQLDMLERTAQKVRRAHITLAASILCVGFALAGAIAWHAFVEREKAIEESVDRQITLMAEEHQQRNNKWWSIRRPFPFEDIRPGVRQNVTEEFLVGKALKVKPHRG